MFIFRLSNVINRYDQYGIMRVNALQSLMVTIGIFLVNFIFSPPYINQLLPIFLIGIIAASSSPSYIRRQQIVASFIVIAIIWYICVNLVVNHNLATIIINGLLLSIMFWLGKKAPIFAAIALICYLLGVILPPLKVSGSFYVYYNLIVMCGIYLIIVLAFMNLFPKIYYQRIWIRAFYLCLKELSLIQRNLAGGETNFVNSKHLIGMYRITSNITQKEFTRAIRRTNISLLRIYTYMTTLRTQLLPINPQALLQSANLCDELCQQIVNGNKIDVNSKLITELPNEIKFALQQLTRIWNETCLKI